MSSKKRGSRRFRRLDDVRVSSRVTPEVILKYFEALDCPRSLTAAILFRNKEYKQLVELSIDPLQYEFAAEFKDAYQATKFLSKNQFLETGIEREQVALDKFFEFEKQCKRTNSLFRTGADYIEDFNPLSNGSLLLAMSRKIRSILGEFDAEELFDRASWGPGVSTLVKGELTFGANKFQLETGITRDLYPLVKDLFPLTYPSWWNHLQSIEDFPQFQVGNQVVTVPKDSKADRVIAIEPGINLWFQLGLGKMLRDRLARTGVNLRSQKRNQNLAKLASCTGKLVTVDFSSASDSISSSLVQALFSNEESLTWFKVMDLIRSKYGTYDKSTFKWAKFSSMGNGFTFELESLIFYTAAFVTCKGYGADVRSISVYGDDVVIPIEAYEPFRQLCEFLGFTVNIQKSYSSGCFRESCGSHYYNGVDCKPIFLKEKIATPQHVFNVANILRIRSHSYYGCDSRFRSLFYFLVHSLPHKLRFRVPAIVNSKTLEIEPLEGGFVSNFDEGVPNRAEFGIEGYLVRRLAWVSVKTEVDFFGVLLHRLSSPTVGLKAEHNSFPLRGRTKCRKTQTLVRQWYDLGPWL
jgi:hypothetical protein